MTGAGRASHRSIITGAARSLLALAPAATELSQGSAELEAARRAAARGYFSPEEDELVRGRFALYLTARAGLHETIRELEPLARGGAAEAGGDTRLRAFAIGYTAACVLVRAGRFLIETVAPDPVLRAKLDEAEPRYRIPRKQFTAVFRSTTSPRNAWRLRDAMIFAAKHRAELEALRGDGGLGHVLAYLDRAEDAARWRSGDYAGSRLWYRLHSLRRRHSSGYRKVMFALFAVAGSTFAEIRARRRPKRITPRLIRQLRAVLEPGDVVITRHDAALTNLFLPGFWPHASLHIGPPEARATIGIECDAERARRWSGEICMIEARKDGVLLRRLEETLAVDAVAVLRPAIDRASIARAISRAISHEGKLYDFLFDFTTADRLVCTEVIYRAFQGAGGIEIAPRMRSGRLTVSAEDLIDLALERRGFEPLAVCGTPAAGSELRLGAEAEAALRAGRERPPAS